MKHDRPYKIILGVQPSLVLAYDRPYKIKSERQIISMKTYQALDRSTKAYDA